MQVQEEVTGQNDEEKHEWTPNNSRITKLLYPVMKLPLEPFISFLESKYHDHFAL